MRYVRPILPVVSYVGGKRKLAPRILPWIEAVGHICYAEPFVGMGGVFLQRRSRPSVEVINDISRDVSTFFRVIQRHYVPFLEMLRYQVTSRAEFERLSATDPDTLTDMERAARFLYLQACAYGGKVLGRTFGVDSRVFHGFDATRVGPMLEALHDRLAQAVVENLPYGEFLRRYDGPGTLFYLDPPYFQSETYYGKGVFGPDDFFILAKQLRDLAGRFILSINATPETREAFAAFEMEEVSYHYTVSRGEPCNAVEMIVTGPPERRWEKANRQGALL
jgi:DNA adenine methylase